MNCLTEAHRKTEYNRKKAEPFDMSSFSRFTDKERIIVSFFLAIASLFIIYTIYERFCDHMKCIHKHMNL